MVEVSETKPTTRALSRKIVSGSPKPLIVDLDGTLIRSDLLHESFFDRLLAAGPRYYVETVKACLKGKSALKHFLANEGDIDYSTLPYNQAVIEFVRKARSEGRPVFLATAAHERHAKAIAAHLGIFDSVFASSQTSNLSRHAKADALTEAFGEEGFDYRRQFLT